MILAILCFIGFGYTNIQSGMTREGAIKREPLRCLCDSFWWSCQKIICPTSKHTEGTTSDSGSRSNSPGDLNGPFFPTCLCTPAHTPLPLCLCVLTEVPPHKVSSQTNYPQVEMSYQSPPPTPRSSWTSTPHATSLVFVMGLLLFFTGLNFI